MTRREYAGGAARTTITGSIASSGGGTVTIASATGWPTGASFKFLVIVDPGLSSEEKILVDSRSGTTLTYSAGGRGYDGSSASAHSSSAVIWHCFGAIDADEANSHINATAAAHTGAMITFPPSGTIAAATVTGAIQELDSESNTRLVAIEANNWVTTARILDANVTTAKILDANVTTAKIADANVTAAKMAANAVATATILDANVTTAKIADANVTAAKLSLPWTSYTPTWSGTLGNGTLTASQLRIGGIQHWWIILVWGSTTSHPASAQTFTLPTTVNASINTTPFPVGSASAATNSATMATAGSCVYVTGSATFQIWRLSNDSYFTNLQPFVWGNGNLLLLNGTYPV